MQGDKIHCLDVLHSLTKYTLGFIEDETEDFAKLTEQMDEKFKKQFPTRKELEIVSSTREWKRLDTAARVIQKFYRLYIRSNKNIRSDKNIRSSKKYMFSSASGMFGESVELKPLVKAIPLFLWDVGLIKCY